MRLLATALLFFLVTGSLRAQRMIGVVCDSAGVPIELVAIQNIHTGAGLFTQADGRFEIDARAGELVEFHKLGYKTSRVRVSSGTSPTMYKIILRLGIELAGVEVRGGFKDYQHDSAYYAEYFKKQINSTSRDLQRFRDEYKWLDQLKYIDYHFNERLITSITGLKGDSALAYMQQYRPAYTALRKMTDYDKLAYINRTVEEWRKREKLNRAIRRE